jgi:nucleotide-binding universal stress UspA family protein
MSYKTILVQIDSGKRCAERLEVAIRLAIKFDACLVGLHAFFPYTPPNYVMAEMGPEIMVVQKEIATELMSRTEETFRAQTSAAGLENMEWHGVYDDPVYAVSLQARYADIVVIGQSDPSDDSGIAMDFPERLVLASGRPVLILPNTGRFPDVGKRILVAWDASREATRAITNAISFLRFADSVYIVAVNPKSSKNDSIPNEEIVRYLSRHGVRAEVKESCGVEIDAGNELLSRASDLSADLIVMGCYGHSRLREWVLGGATRIMLESMTVAVLMSH